MGSGSARSGGRDASGLRRRREDFAPLILLFSVGLTGLMVTAGLTWREGCAYDVVAILHGGTVIGTLLGIPLARFFHVLQQPPELGVGLDVGAAGEPATCPRCGMPGSPVGPSLCPPCRRASFAVAPGGLWQGPRERSRSRDDAPG